VPKHAKWSKVLFLMLFSLEIAVSGLAAMYIVSFFLKPSRIINSTILVLAGVVGFALGSIIFWHFSIRISRWRSDFKR